MHWVKADILHSAQYQQHGEEEQQRHRRAEAQSRRERSWIELLRHLHPQVESGDQALVLPLQIPAAIILILARRRDAACREVNVVTVGVHVCLEVLHAGHGAVLAESVAPTVHALGFIRHQNRCCLPGTQLDR